MLWCHICLYGFLEQPILMLPKITRQTHCCNSFVDLPGNEVGQTKSLVISSSLVAAPKELQDTSKVLIGIY